MCAEWAAQLPPRVACPQALPQGNASCMCLLVLKSLWVQAALSQKVPGRESRAWFWHVEGLAVSSPWLFGVSACLCAALPVLCLWLRLWGAGAQRTPEVSKPSLGFAG